MTEETAELMPREGVEITSTEQRFGKIMTEAQAAVDKSKAINVTDPADVRGMKAAREARLEIRRIRLEAVALHKDLKADVLRVGRALDGGKNIILQVTEPEEKRLEHCEKLAERIQAQRDQELQEQREGELQDLGMDPRAYGQLHQIPDDAWKMQIDGIKLAQKEKAEAEKKAREEEERKRKEEEAERARIKDENERLKKEAEAREKAAAEERAKHEAERKAAEAKAKAEREALEAQARKEREAREKAQREADAKLAEEKRKADELAAKEKARIEAERKAKEEDERLERERAEASAKAPDRQRLTEWLENAFPVLPEMKTEAGKESAHKIADQMSKARAWVETVISKM